jgi:hypothetical protein
MVRFWFGGPVDRWKVALRVYSEELDPDRISVLLTAMVYYSKDREHVEIERRTDGSFSFDTIRPREPFTVFLSDYESWSLPPQPVHGVQSEEIILQPGESREVNLRLPVASALTGTVEDETGREIEK